MLPIQRRWQKPKLKTNILIRITANNSKKVEKPKQTQVQRKTSNQLPKTHAPNQGEDGENDETLRPG
jgi:hypothetical protein